MEITAGFKMIFLTVVAITILCFLGIAVLAAFGSGETDLEKVSVMERNFYTACSFGWQSGLGAIFGLLGGNATSSDGSPED